MFSGCVGAHLVVSDQNVPRFVKETLDNTGLVIKFLN